MKVFNTIKSLQADLSSTRKQDVRIGFIPTMGALHEGHISLIETCKGNNDIPVASIYVNPTQFNDPGDLKNYPRQPDKDLEMLERAGCRYAFLPSDHEMYPEPDTRVFDFGDLGSIMEGKYRPGHFNGVAQIVSKLFDAVKPDRAYFGKKDFQQLAIIRRLVSDLHLSVEIVGCPIIRESDGLAMSSRNKLLSPVHRKAAPNIYQTLKTVKDMAQTADVSEIESFVFTAINSNPYLKLEYFQIVDSSTLKKINLLHPGTPVTACIAVFAGSVRLIDNIDLFS